MKSTVTPSPEQSEPVLRDAELHIGVALQPKPRTSAYIGKHAAQQNRSIDVMRIPTATILVFGVSLTSFGASTTTKSQFYRHLHQPAPRPRSSSGPVVVNAASFEPGVSPGCLATVFGADLTSVAGIIVAQSTPLPKRLAGVTVLVNGIAAPIYSIAFANGEDQISFQVPNVTPTGPGTAQVEVLDGDVETANIISDSFTEDPGIFTYNSDFAVAVNSVDGSLIGPDNRAAPGDIVVLYTTGLGPVSLEVPDGFPAPGNPLAFTVDPLQVMVNNENSTVLFSGLAPGFVGLYQINFRVPFDAPSGDLDLQIQTPYASSRIVTLPVY